MRRAFALFSASFALLATAMACATFDDGDSAPPPDAGPTILPDAGGTDGDRGDAAPPAVPSCSSAGWCITALPDTELTLKDIWPFERRAFAIAESPTLGVKVLEWDDATRGWTYIDDDSQNNFEHDTYAGKIWAPNENEIYFGAGHGFIHHGKRTAPSSPWSWTRTKLEVDSPDGRDHGRIEYRNRSDLPREVTALGVWGMSADDVYAWYANTIFHWKSEGGGAPSWVAEHVIEDPETPEDAFFVFDASGSSSDDVWFAAGRGRFDDRSIFRCPMVIRKTKAGYDRVVDNMIDTGDTASHYYDTCIEKKGVLAFSWANARGTMHWGNGGFLTNIESAGPGRAVGVIGEDLFAYVESPGVARVNYVGAQVPRDVLPSLVSSVWIHGQTAWLSGWGIVLETPNDPVKWSTGLGLLSKDGAQQLGLPAATFTFSSTAINGAPLDAPLHQVRGSSNTNLWAIGRQYALHKTTP